MTSLAGSLMPSSLMSASMDTGVNDELIAIERLQTDATATFFLLASSADCFTASDELLSLNVKIASLRDWGGEEMEVIYSVCILSKETCV